MEGGAKSPSMATLIATFLRTIEQPQNNHFKAPSIAPFYSSHSQNGSSSSFQMVVVGFSIYAKKNVAINLINYRGGPIFWGIRYNGTVPSVSTYGAFFDMVQRGSDCDWTRGDVIFAPRE
jgi:hypothetical protein